MEMLHENIHFKIFLLIRPQYRPKGHNTDLPLDSNISKTERLTLGNIFQRIFNKLSDGMQDDRLCTCGSQVIDV